MPNFNPLTPGGVRHKCPGVWGRAPRFQSTHPVWGETNATTASSATTSHFNPLTPCGVRLILATGEVRQKKFQSTHPVWGETDQSRRRACRTGHFNPLTPCGVRPSHGIYGRRRRHFNPLTPCGVRPIRRRSSGAMTGFQSTHPVWGETIVINVLDPATHKFQSTHPVWGETLACLPSLVSSTISIHSPRVG